MATEILRPQDCLSSSGAHNLHSFSPPTQKLFSDRRKSRPLRTNQAASSPSPSPSRTPKTKHARPNRKSASPPSTPPLSTSPLQDGFRLLRRGEPFLPAQPGSQTAPSNTVSTTRLDKTKNQSPPRKKNQSDRVASRSEPTMTPPHPPPLPPPPMNLSRAGSDEEELRYAGLNCSLCAPAPECVPKPGFLMRSTGMGASSSSDEVASRTLRGLLKLDFM